MILRQVYQLHEELKQKIEEIKNGNDSDKQKLINELKIEFTNKIENILNKYK